MKLPRRTFLRGLGALVALPAIEAMGCAGEGESDEDPGGLSNGEIGARRTVFVVSPNGFLPETFFASDTGAPDPAEPLTAVRQHLRFVRGLQNEAVLTRIGELHTELTGSVLAGVQLILEARRPWSPGVGRTADQLIADAVGASTRFPSLALGSEVQDRACSGEDCRYTASVSWRDARTPVPKDVSLRRLFRRLFGDGSTERSAAAQARREALGQSVLDAVADDARTLGARIGAQDRARVDAYLTALRDVERGIASLTPAVGAAARALSLELAGGDPIHEVHVRLMYRLLALALQADLTRVATYMPGAGASSRVFGTLGITEPHHSLSHLLSAAARSQLARVERWELARFAEFIAALRDMPEGEGSLLDTTQVVYLSEMGDGESHSPRALPVLIAGGARGLVRPGRTLVAEGAPLADLLTTVIQNAGVEVTRFGRDGRGALRGLYRR